ncbi:50S ribosomal protein L21 [bacterium]|nr:50S ribosomal protein L21 [bacterium]
MIMKQAVVETAGTQMLLREGESVITDLREEGVGMEVILDSVLLLVDGDTVKVGKPVVADGKVTCKVVRHFKDKKIRVQKFKPKKNYRRVIGHRQRYTELRVVKIEG